MKYLLIALAAGTAMVLTGCEENRSTEQAAESASAAQAGPESDANVSGAGSERHSATGKVTAVDPSAASVTLFHDPMPTLEWPSMTMDFNVADPDLLQGVEVGDQVDFVITQDSTGAYVIQEIRKL